MLTGALLGITIHAIIAAFGLRDKPETTTTSRTSAIASSTSSRKKVLSSASISAHGQQPHPPVSRMLFPSSIPTILEEEDEDSSFQVGRQRSKKGGLDALLVDTSDNSSDL